MIYSTNILLWNPYREILVVSRKENPKQFSMPGGKVDACDYSDYTDYYKHYKLPNPSLTVLRNTASRELKEETGIYISPSDFQPVFTAAHKWKDLEYECTTFFAMSEAEPRAIEPGTWVGWRKPEDLVNPELNPFWDFVVRLYDFIGIRVSVKGT